LVVQFFTSKHCRMTASEEPQQSNRCGSFWRKTRAQAMADFKAREVV
jgi:hypothetical protein